VGGSLVSFPSSEQLRRDTISAGGPKGLFPAAGYGLANGMSDFPPHLISGYQTFRSQRLPTEQSRYRELSERGQSPAVMVIGCCDSRVSPEVIFDAGPGELFVVRNVANLVPVYQPDGGAHGVSAALEYAVSVLHVRHIVVLGHAQCGGIRAFIDNIEPLSPGDFIGRWMSMFIKPGEKVEQRDQETMQDFTIRIEKAAVFRSLENLMTFPFVRAVVERGELDLHGAYFGVAEGSLSVLDPSAKEFYRVME
jgi:carbonic anhydrase